MSIRDIKIPEMERTTHAAAVFGFRVAVPDAVPGPHHTVALSCPHAALNCQMGDSCTACSTDLSKSRGARDSQFAPRTRTGLVDALVLVLASCQRFKHHYKSARTRTSRRSPSINGEAVTLGKPNLLPRSVVVLAPLCVCTDCVNGRWTF